MSLPNTSSSNLPEISEESLDNLEPNLINDQPEMTGKEAIATVRHSQEEKNDEVPVSSSNTNPETTSFSPLSSSEDDIDKNMQEQSSSPPSLPTALPLVSLSDGLNKKASGYTAQSWISLSLTLDGRDKITKVVQYTARLLSWWFGQKAMNNPAHSERFKNLYKAVAQSRKAFRLGRSFIEIEKLRTMGLVQVLLYHLRVSLNSSSTDDDKNNGNDTEVDYLNDRPHLARRASSNIGWGPSTMPSPRSSRGLYRSLSNISYRMYRPMVSQLSLLGPSSRPSKAPTWKIIGTSLKLLGLLGFWTGDNVAFLNSTGFFDNHTLQEKDRLTKRTALQTRATNLAFRSYFMASLAGLVVNWKSYWDFRRKEIKDVRERLDTLCKDSENTEEDVRVKRARQDAKEAGEKQFVLFLALLKSCCDVLVFSNNTGIDLHKKYRGKKMHEGFHCLCGLVSASTVMYNNFPNADY